MSLQCGIIGLPNVGKSTCLNALSKVNVAAANNYPFCTIEPNRSSVPVPDQRLEIFKQLINPASLIPTKVTFVDIAGIVSGASKGEGLGNRFLSHIKAVDAIIHVVRCFESAEIIHVDGEVNPLKDIKTIETELLLADIETLEKSIKRYEKLVKSGDKEAKQQMGLLLRAKECLHQELPLRFVAWAKEEKKQLNAYQFLTLKPVLYLANVSEEGFQNNHWVDQVRQHAQKESAGLVVSCVELESKLIDMPELEKQDLLSLLDYSENSLGQLIREAYNLLGLHTFFTAGPKEVRAWTLAVGGTAFDAAGCIHSDFQRGFIAAEVVAYEDFIHLKSEQEVKKAGKYRLEKKDYLVKDGDIIHFRFNV